MLLCTASACGCPNSDVSALSTIRSVAPPVCAYACRIPIPPCLCVAYTCALPPFHARSPMPARLFRLVTSIFSASSHPVGVGPPKVSARLATCPSHMLAASSLPIPPSCATIAMFVLARMMSFALEAMFPGCASIGCPSSLYVSCTSGTCFPPAVRMSYLSSVTIMPPLHCVICIAVLVGPLSTFTMFPIAGAVVLTMSASIWPPCASSAGAFRSSAYRLCWMHVSVAPGGAIMQ